VKPHILIAPAGARNLKSDDHLRRWPAELYVTLTELLLARNLEVTLIGGPDDVWILPHFESLLSSNPSLTSQIGKLKLPQTLALMDASDLLITHDTGPLHMAGITHASIVAIFGPTDPRGRLPQRPGTVALWGGEGFACRPCYDGHTFADCPSNDCMRQITPAMVLTEALTVPPGTVPPGTVPPGTPSSLIVIP
jgi:heptosyltransferase-2